jgi:MFS transporter, NNP family, nitrate/nitrite transporter
VYSGSPGSVSSWLSGHGSLSRLWYVSENLYDRSQSNRKQLSVTIKKDLKMTQNEVANSNIIALVATLLVRFCCGPLCDRFGPRYVFAGCLLLGALPSVLAGTATTPTGLIVIRFFVGILGGSFVPCQVWTTAFFDKNVVGTGNSLTGGLGNAGGGIT